MKLTEKKLKQLIKEAMEEREFDFSGMISKGMNYEGLRGVIELLLDSEDIKYDIVDAGDKVNYQFYKDSREDFYWYQPLDALVDAFNQAGFTDESKRSILAKPTAVSFRQLDNHSWSSPVGRTLVIYNNSPKKT